MEFHVSRAVRSKTGVDDVLFNYAGNVVFGSLTASREFVKRFNEARAASGETGPVLHAGALFAMGLIDELNHAMIARYRETLDPEVLPQALRWFEAEANREPVRQLLLEFTQEFPTVDVYRGHQTPGDWLDATTPAAQAKTQKDLPNREIAMEELLMLWLANTNPAFAPFKELFDDRNLEEKTVYKGVTAEFPHFFATRPQLAGQGSLLDALLAPMLASPDSLSGQLAFMRDNWTQHLGPQFGEMLRRTILAVDILKEEDIAIWTMFHPAPGGRHGHGDGKWGAEGFIGDEFVGFGDGILGADGRRRYPEQPPPLNEYEAFSPDQAWMPTVVMIAKSTYVWLEQLSKKYQRHIHRLDHIPGEELELLASRGINALWLIGLWERSVASQTIKRLMGQHDAVASAYSLKDYRIADDLGGNYAYERLRDTAGRYGIRLASDMVPNHMGIDSNWVMEHPDWFLARHESPFPVYSFEGPDLSTESRFEIKIEDHYFNQSDAAVVFRLRERSNGDTRFVYHGNDGTTFAWNDTAQLDYSKAYVREQVIQTILAVARLFPIIRFDAAMTLAKKHVQRLWFPLPGIGGSIPSRAESAISQAEFDALMPNEFWREVVDRVAVEVPGTLLLAEAFWLLEGYFVRTLGMHRVYNSAFMNMLRDEENAKYRSYLKKTIEFDPDILKRYVNFMSNPDEKTAIDQFGTGDKYFGTCTMLATIPGLPMFGHGQIEGFTEKYGMEYKQARFVEWPNEDLVARHQREIAPLLKNRQLFAESHNFVMYDFWVGENNVNENVFAYSNRVDHWGEGYGGSGKERALVLYNNSYSSTHGTIHVSVASMDKGSGELRQRTLKDALHLPSDPGVFLAWRDSASGLEYLRCSSDFDQSGFTLELRGYQYAVLGGWRELRSTAEQPWDQLAGALHGGGVYSVDEALSKLKLRPLHETLRHALAPEILQTFAQLTAPTVAAAVADALATRPTVVPESEEAPELVSPIVAAPDAARSEEVEGIETVAEDRAAVPQNPVPAQASRFADFLDRAGVFFDQAGVTESNLDDTMGVEDHAASETAQFLATVEGISSLPLLEAKLGAPWPETARKVMPAPYDPTGHEGVDPLWAPVLAWLLIDRLAPPDEDAAALFDQLHLRSALAEIFSSLGVEGQNAWRLAARVRLLLAFPDVRSVEEIADAALWSDPDLRWLTALNESNGVTYLNKECFEEMMWWLQVPRLIESVGGSSAADVEEASKFLAAAGAAAVAAGYDLAKLQAALSIDANTDESSPTESAVPTLTDEAMDTSTEAVIEAETTAKR
jgi:hypothetical protein